MSLSYGFICMMIEKWAVLVTCNLTWQNVADSSLNFNSWQDLRHDDLSVFICHVAENPFKKSIDFDKTDPELISGFWESLPQHSIIVLVGHLWGKLCTFLLYIYMVVTS